MSTARLTVLALGVQMTSSKLLSSEHESLMKFYDSIGELCPARSFAHFDLIFDFSKVAHRALVSLKMKNVLHRHRCSVNKIPLLKCKLVCFLSSQTKKKKRFFFLSDAHRADCNNVEAIWPDSN